MNWHILLVSCSMAVCAAACVYHIARLIKLGLPKDYSVKSGDVNAAIKYSFTGAMSPKQKESAYLHLPTYTLGILYHIGTFVALPLLVLAMAGILIPNMIAVMLGVFLALTASAGFGILGKRIFVQKLAALSNPDDYISNVLVSLFQASIALYLFVPVYAPVAFVVASCLFLYLPVGKLKHAVYFFAARVHLGYFYGWRGVWPPQN
jgi:nitrate reductase gamma subunit